MVISGEIQPISCSCDLPPPPNMIVWFFFLVNIARHCSGNFKPPLLIQFSSDLGPTLSDHWPPWNEIYYFSWQSVQLFKKMWHFDILTWESNGKILKYAIHVFWKWLIVETFGTRIFMNCIVRYFHVWFIVQFVVIQCALYTSTEIYLHNV